MERQRLFGADCLSRSGQQSSRITEPIVRGNMNRTAERSMSTALSSLLLLGAFAGLVVAANAQSPEMQQRIAEIKAASAKNKQALMSYSWNEQDTISIKGDVKKVQHYQVRLGPDGKPQKTSLDPPTEAAPPSGGRMTMVLSAMPNSSSLSSIIPICSSCTTIRSLYSS